MQPGPARDDEDDAGDGDGQRVAHPRQRGTGQGTAGHEPAGPDQGGRRGAAQHRGDRHALGGGEAGDEGAGPGDELRRRRGPHRTAADGHPPRRRRPVDQARDGGREAEPARPPGGRPGPEDPAEGRAEHRPGGDGGHRERSGDRTGAGQDAQSEDERPGRQDDADDQARLGHEHQGDDGDRGAAGRALGEHRQAGRRESPATPSTGPPRPAGNGTPVSCSDSRQTRAASSGLRSRR